jgi:UDP-N-acetylmuramoyl-tripeptide--D-alanyl-D-alanine ligase
MGMNNLGEISRLSNIGKPDVAVITNIGVSHIENLGSRENILKAKLEILDGLSSDGTVVLNGDDKMLYALCGILGNETLYYGINNPNCDIVAGNIRKSAAGSEFTVTFNGEEYKIAINVPGEHHIYNALAATLIGIRYNIPMAKIIQGIAEFLPGEMRQNIVKLDNYTLIEDCYNASPDSMKAGFDVLTGLAKECKDDENRTVAVLGNMLELGEFAKQEHINVGKLVYDFGIDVLITVGLDATYIADGAREAGFDGEIYSFENNERLKNKIMELIKYGDFILFKGSRGMKLEEVSQYVAGK